DIKPDNVIITKDYRFIFADYGLADEVIQDMEQEMSIAGTFYYLHPNIAQAYINGKSTYRVNPFEADNYSLQITLQEVSDCLKDIVNNSLEKHVVFAKFR